MKLELSRLFLKISIFFSKSQKKIFAIHIDPENQPINFIHKKNRLPTFLLANIF